MGTGAGKYQKYIRVVTAPVYLLRIEYLLNDGIHAYTAKRETVKEAEKALETALAKLAPIRCRAEIKEEREGAKI